MSNLSGINMTYTEIYGLIFVIILLEITLLIIIMYCLPSSRFMVRHIYPFLVPSCKTKGFLFYFTVYCFFRSKIKHISYHISHRISLNGFYSLLAVFRRFVQALHNIYYVFFLKYLLCFRLQGV